MNKHEKEMTDRLDSMPIEEARKRLASGTFGDIASPDYNFCFSWLSVKEASLRDANASDAVRWAQKATYAAYIAAILAFLSIITTIIIAIYK